MKLTREQIMELQPHRDPIQLVDEVLELVLGDYVIGRWYVRPDLEVLKGHFPGDPILPGIYIMESAGQASSMVRAIDFHVEGVSVDEVAAYIETLMPHSGGLIIYRSQGFIHVDDRSVKYRAVA